MTDISISEEVKRIASEYFNTPPERRAAVQYVIDQRGMGACLAEGLKERGVPVRPFPATPAEPMFSIKGQI